MGPHVGTASRDQETGSRVFVAGDRVVHEGTLYQAKWWTRGQEPGDPDGPWELVG